MNFLRLVRSQCSAISRIVPRLLSDKIPALASIPNAFNFSTLTYRVPVNGFLVPKAVAIMPSCGLKIKGKMRLRCKDCYYVRREGRLYVMCLSFPRHKQTHMMKKEKHTWIFSHACQSQLRPY